MDKENVVSIHNGILLRHKKISLAATWMGLGIIILSEANHIYINKINYIK